MQVWKDHSEVPRTLIGSVVAIGNFDGVHAGHRHVLGNVVKYAAKVSEECGETILPVAVTFHPHPLQVLYPDRAPEMVMSHEEKLSRLAETGLAAVLDLEFTHELARQTPEHFVRETFVDGLRARAVVVGHDVRFGHKNAGNIETLKELGAQLGFQVLTMDDIGGGAGSGYYRRWSSSWLRELIADGDVSGAASLLTRPHLMQGRVVHGDHRGREIGYPTANLAPDSEGMVPDDGVYAGWLTPRSGEHAGERLPAAISIGTNPTFDGTQRRVESYVLDRTDLDLYDVEVVVEFVRRLRPTVKFGSLEALLEQMADDVVQCREILGVPTP